MQCEEDSKQTIVEASWAPRDPRDLSDDDTATNSEKIVSQLQIIGSYHPVLNVFVLAFRFCRRCYSWSAGALMEARSRR